MNSNERRLKVLYQLQSGKKVTSKDLMNKFGISKRTVFRDLRVIQEMGVPVTHDPEMGYGIMRDGMIPPIMFSFRELSVIMVGLSFVTSQIDDEMVNDAENVLLKIRSSVPATLKKQMNILESKTLVSPYIHNINERNRGGDWFTLCSAFVENKPVSFLYQKQNSVQKRRTIDPQLLIHYTDHWNVIGYCHDRKTLRNFNLSKMSDLSLTDKPKLLKNEPDREQLLYGRFEDSREVSVEIDSAVQFSFLTELPGKVLKKKIKGSRVQITFEFDNLSFINKWLLRFGDSVQVIEPTELKHLRIKLLKKLLGKEEKSD